MTGSAQGGHACECACGQAVEVAGLDAAEALMVLARGMCGERLRAQSEFHLHQGLSALVKAVGTKIVIDAPFGSQAIEVRSYPPDTVITAKSRT
jgi:hypothetical protein